MFKRNRQQPAGTATGMTHCRLCGIDVELDSLGRCRLGHRVATPAERRDEALVGPDAWLVQVDDATTEFAPVTAEPQDPEADEARVPSVSAFPAVSAAASPLVSAFPSVSPFQDVATASGAIIGPEVDSEDAGEGDDESVPPAPTASTGADASRDRLREAASWFSMNEDS